MLTRLESPIGVDRDPSDKARPLTAKARRRGEIQAFSTARRTSCTIYAVLYSPTAGLQAPVIFEKIERDRLTSTCTPVQSGVALNSRTRRWRNVQNTKNQTCCVAERGALQQQ